METFKIFNRMKKTHKIAAISGVACLVFAVVASKTSLCSTGVSFLKDKFFVHCSQHLEDHNDTEHELSFSTGNDCNHSKHVSYLRRTSARRSLQKRVSDRTDTFDARSAHSDFRSIDLLLSSRDLSIPINHNIPNLTIQQLKTIVLQN